ncbi:MAG: hypothetical protein GX560_04140, partial [Deinococcales bacterium]|nr:hypothetical protein [Deinococcales bacterium]
RGRAGEEAAMWMWTLDDRLINVTQVESIELLPVLPEEADPEAFEAGEVEADYYELIAVMASGDEAPLYEAEDADQAELAFQLLAGTLALASGGDTKLDEPFSVHQLLEEHRKLSN